MAFSFIVMRVLHLAAAVKKRELKALGIFDRQ